MLNGEFHWFVAHHFSHREKVNSNGKADTENAMKLIQKSKQWTWLVSVCNFCRLEIWIQFYLQNLFQCMLSVFLYFAYFVQCLNVTDPVYFCVKRNFCCCWFVSLYALNMVSDIKFSLCTYFLYILTAFGVQKIYTDWASKSNFINETWNKLNNATLHLYYQPSNRKENVHEIWHCFPFCSGFHFFFRHKVGHQMLTSPFHLLIAVSGVFTVMFLFFFFLWFTHIIISSTK